MEESSALSPAQDAPPGAAALREEALAYLARFSATERGLRQMLERRLRRWAARAIRAGMAEDEAQARLDASRSAIDAIVKAMIRLGALDDAGFARSRAASLTRTGHSRRAVAAHLANKGVEQDTARAALDESLGERADDSAREAELAAALILARKRGLGPFRKPGRPEAPPERVLGVFARGGFARDVARSALHMDAEEAEALIVAVRGRL